MAGAALCVFGSVRCAAGESRHPEKKGMDTSLVWSEFQRKVGWDDSARVQIESVTTPESDNRFDGTKKLLVQNKLVNQQALGKALMQSWEFKGCFLSLSLISGLSVALPVPVGYSKGCPLVLSMRTCNTKHFPFKQHITNTWKPQPPLSIWPHLRWFVLSSQCKTTFWSLSL